MNKQTYIHIKNLRIKAFHGVLPQESKVGNDYMINLRIGYPWIDAAIADDLNHTINYVDVAKVITSTMQRPTLLVETVAKRIADELKRKYTNIKSIELKITKLNPPMPYDCEGAGVELVFNYDGSE